MFKGKKNILWDFDGVIIDSSKIREFGFKKVLADYPSNERSELLDYHKENGGLSRYVKFRYFFEKIRGEKADEHKINVLAQEFSEIMKSELRSTKFLIPEVTDFIRSNCKKYRMHIVSGSDQKELRYLCKELGIENYFHSINGSPVAKIELVENLLERNNYKLEETCLIGDSINDFEAADVNEIDFFGYNNPKLKEKGLNYVEHF